MPILTGEWWNQGTRPMLKQRAGAVTADVEQADIASCAVTSGSVAAGAITCGALAAGAVGATATLGTGIVSSEVATAILRTRTASAATADPAKGAGYGTTSYTVWRPSVRAEITQVRLVPLTAWSAVTSCGNLQIWTCVGAVGSFTACTTGVGPAGVPLLLTGLANTCVAACQDVMLGISNINACDDVPAHLVLVEYVTSG